VPVGATDSLNDPSGLAFHRGGNLWVAKFVSDNKGSLAEFASNKIATGGDADAKGLSRFQRGGQQSRPPAPAYFRSVDQVLASKKKTAACSVRFVHRQGEAEAVRSTRQLTRPGRKGKRQVDCLVGALAAAVLVQLARTTRTWGIRILILRHQDTSELRM
jgi:hypothetical protein